MLEFLGLLLAKAAAQVVIKGVLDWVKGRVWKEESVEQNMLGILIGKDFKTGLAYLSDARDTEDDDKMQRELINDARRAFTCASQTEQSSTQQAKSMFCTAMCFQLLGQRPNAIKWFEAAKNKGDGLNRAEVREIEEFIKKLRTDSTRRFAIESSSSTYDSIVNQPRRLESVSSSYTSDRTSSIERGGTSSYRDQMAIQQQDMSDRSIFRHPEKVTKICTINHGNIVYDVQFSPNGHFLATAGKGGQCKIWGEK